MINYLQPYKKAPETWVILPFIMVILPHLSRFPGWLLIVISGLLGWRIYAINNSRRLPGKFILAIITVMTTLGILFEYGTLMGKTAGTAFLVVLLCIKLLESNSQGTLYWLLPLVFLLS
ncbi:MAG: DUF3488 domain-containing protein [Gammaproteobacteria bacterium]|nr:DUF3488 domain-containing protein [Gammaproteobacteria bacterium]